MNVRRTVTAACLCGLLFAGGAVAGAPEDSAIQIVKAIYGPPGAVNPHDFSARLQQTCGAKAGVCESY